MKRGIVFFLLFIATPVVAEPATGSICVGYDAERGTWGGKSSWASGSDGMCPKQHAAVGATIDAPRTPHIGPEATPITIYCCPMPAGALGESETTVTGRCPANAVVTGVLHDDESPPKFLLRCTSLNTPFALGEATPGGRLETAADPIAAFRREAVAQVAESSELPRISWGELPVSMRYAIGRTGLTSWQDKAIVGRPHGALLTAVPGNLETEIEFRLLRRTTDNNPVRLFRKCQALSNKFDPSPECLP